MFILHTPNDAVYDYRSLDTVQRVSANNFSSQFYISLEAYSDGLREGREGFVLRLDLDESELDPRDVGHVSLSRSVYIFEIIDSGTVVTRMEHNMM